MLNDIYHALDPVAFAIGPFAVRWYGIAYLLGFLCAGIIIYFVAKRWRLRFGADDLLTVLLCAIVGIIVGARLGYCLFYGTGYYLANPIAILQVNEGGMSFHGGLIGALLGGIVAAKLTGIPYMTLADLGCIAAPVGLFFGRCANFINGELWGAITDAPWGVVFGGLAGSMPRHPSQLYEALLEGLVIFCVLFALSRKVPPRPRGTFLGLFLVMYGVFRFLIEFVRQPDEQLGYLFGGLAGSMPRHPSQLYEALLEGLVIFCVLFALSRKVPPRPRGTFLGLFLVMYGVFRFLIEFVRQPDEQLGYLLGGWVTMGQLLSVPLIVVGIVILWWVWKKRLPQEGSPDREEKTP